MSGDGLTKCREEGCGAPSVLIGRSGWCRGHDPNLKEELREQGRRGGATTRARYGTTGLLESDLGVRPNADAAQIQEGLRRVTAAVGERRITHSEGQAMIAGLKQMLAARDLSVREGQLSEVLKRLDVIESNRARMRAVR